MPAATISVMATPATGEALRLLIEERDRLDQAIRLLQGGAFPDPARPRRGRPPKAASRLAAIPRTAKKAEKRKGRPPMTAEEKRAASERMKKYWAERKTAKVGKFPLTRPRRRSLRGVGRILPDSSAPYSWRLAAMSEPYLKSFSNTFQALEASLHVWHIATLSLETCFTSDIEPEVLSEKRLASFDEIPVRDGEGRIVGVLHRGSSGSSLASRSQFKKPFVFRKHVVVERTDPACEAAYLYLFKFATRLETFRNTCPTVALMGPWLCSRGNN